jgi:small conductance mechanosensitive channel
MDITKTTTDLFSHNLPEFVKGIILLVLTVIIAKIIQLRISYVKASIEKNKSDQKTEVNNKIIMLTVGNIIYWLIIIFGILISLKYFGIDVSSLLVVLGTVGLAIGLAMQNTLTEIISGIMILLLNYYEFLYNYYYEY